MIRRISQRPDDQVTDVYRFMLKKPWKDRIVFTRVYEVPASFHHRILQFTDVEQGGKIEVPLR